MSTQFIFIDTRIDKDLLVMMIVQNFLNWSSSSVGNATSAVLTREDLISQQATTRFLQKFKLHYESRKKRRFYQKGTFLAQMNKNKYMDRGNSCGNSSSAGIVAREDTSSQIASSGSAVSKRKTWAKISRAKRRRLRLRIGMTNQLSRHSLLHMRPSWMQMPLSTWLRTSW